jgi:hypothetical protein
MSYQATNARPDHPATTDFSESVSPAVYALSAIAYPLLTGLIALGWGFWVCLALLHEMMRPSSPARLSGSEFWGLVLSVPAMSFFFGAAYAALIRRPYALLMANVILLCVSLPAIYVSWLLLG